MQYLSAKKVNQRESYSKKGRYMEKMNLILVAQKNISQHDSSVYQSPTAHSNIQSRDNSFSRNMHQPSKSVMLTYVGEDSIQDIKKNISRSQNKPNLHLSMLQSITHIKALTYTAKYQVISRSPPKITQRSINDRLSTYLDKLGLKNLSSMQHKQPRKEKPDYIKDYLSEDYFKQQKNKNQYYKQYQKIKSLSIDKNQRQVDTLVDNQINVLRKISAPKGIPYKKQIRDYLQDLYNYIGRTEPIQNNQNYVYLKSRRLLVDYCKNQVSSIPQTEPIQKNNI